METDTLQTLSLDLTVRVPIKQIEMGTEAKDISGLQGVSSSYFG